MINSWIYSSHLREDISTRKFIIYNNWVCYNIEKLHFLKCKISNLLLIPKCGSNNIKISRFCEVVIDKSLSITRKITSGWVVLNCASWDGSRVADMLPGWARQHAHTNDSRCDEWWVYDMSIHGYNRTAMSV